MLIKYPFPRFLKPIQQIEESLQQPSEEEQEDNGNPAQQVYIEHFSMEELHYTLKRNNGRVVGLYDEVSLLYEQLDKYRNGSSDRKTLLSLINGSPWRRNFRNSNSVVPKTWFNLAGFVQPDVIVNLLHGNDYDGFLDRQFFVCPPEVDTDYDDMKDMPQDATSFKEMFHIIDDNHTTDSLYTLDDNAKLEFVAFHDEINERKRKEHRRDRDRKSVLSKAKGQVLRLAAVGFALHQAICTAEDPSIQWQYTITKDHMLKAIYLVNFLIEQKFSLGKEKHSVTESTAESDVPSDLHRMKRLLELSSPVTVAKISQNHIQRRVDKKYRKEEAIDLMEEAAKYDLATVVTEKYNAGRNERLKKELRKRTADNLTDKSKDILKRMKVDMDKYFT